MRFTISIPHDDSTTRARERSTAALDEQYGYFGIKGLAPSRWQVRPTHVYKDYARCSMQGPK
jgi:hypothetical protein